MKQFKRILCFALTILMVCTLMAAAAPVRAAGGSVDMGDVIQLLRALSDVQRVVAESLKVGDHMQEL